MRLTATQLRERYAELREIVNSWDPIGVLGDPNWPRDEYDCLVGPILRRLETGVVTSDLGSFLHGELTGHFGLSTSREVCNEWARQASAWFTTRWPSTEAVPLEEC